MHSDVIITLQMHIEHLSCYSKKLPHNALYNNCAPLLIPLVYENSYSAKSLGSLLDG